MKPIQIYLYHETTDTELLYEVTEVRIRGYRDEAEIIGIEARCVDSDTPVEDPTVEERLIAVLEDKHEDELSQIIQDHEINADESAYDHWKENRTEEES